MTKTKIISLSIILTLLVIWFVNACIFEYKFWFYEPDKTIEYPTVNITYNYIPMNVAYRNISAYNAGDPYQTDNSPCIGAMGSNICSGVARGEKLCAANFVPFGTVLEIRGYGECMVVDRMNSRYPDRIDIAMAADEKDQALAWGVKNLLVIVK